MTLQNPDNKIKQAKNNTYKYLGLPISNKGIKKKDYLTKQRKAFFAKRIIMNQFCDENNLNLKHRLAIYKSMIRSQYDYGTHIIDYSKHDIEKLEWYQNIVIKSLLNIKKEIDYKTMLIALELPSIENRIDKSKICFFYKIRNSKENRSMAKKVFDTLFDNKTAINTIKKQTPPIINYEKIMKKNEAKALFTRNNDMNNIEIKIFTRNLLDKLQSINTAKYIEKRQFYKINKNIGTMPFRKNKIAPINNMIKNKIKITKNIAYINDHDNIINLNLVNTLGECDHNTKWYAYNHPCKLCNTYNIKRKNIHQITSCKFFKLRRAKILNSLNIELENLFQRLENKNKGINDKYKITKINLELIKKAIDSKLNNEESINLINFLIGNTISLHNPKRNEILAILHSHFLLLNKMLNNQTINDEDNYTIINYENKNYKLNSTDLKKGMIVVRENYNNKTHYMNIRKLIESFSINDLQKYNVGLGAASSRTDKQKKMAQNYTDEVLKRIKSTWITSDASINNNTEKGGYGLIAINKNNEIIYKEKDTLNTNDAQLGELTGIYNSLLIVKNKKIKIENEIAFVCDCKNAIKIITNYLNCPLKYKIIIQEINECLYYINNIMKIKTYFHWIPGHTDNKYNDIVDKLAKEAANSWVDPAKNTPSPPSSPLLLQLSLSLSMPSVNLCAS